MAFPFTVLPIVHELLIDGAWSNVTADVRRDDGNGIRISRKPQTWGDNIAPTTASWTFDNLTRAYSWRHPSSANFNKIGRGTQTRIRLRPVYDTFTRTASSSWGAPNTGPTWTTSGGSASDHSVSAGVGNQSLGTRAVARIAASSQKLRDFDLTFDATNPVVPTGDVIERGVRARWVDANNFVDVRVFYNTADTVSLITRQVVAGVETTSGFTTVTGLTTTAAISCRFQGKGKNLRAKLYAVGADESAVDWQRTQAVTHLTAGTFEFYAQLSAGNSNGLPVVETWDNIEISNYRFWGEIPSWTPQGDSTGNDRYLPVLAGGLSQRLGQGQRPLDSALTTAMAGVSEGDFVPLAHWPLEDAVGTRLAGNLVVGGAPAVITGGVTMAAYAGAAGSNPVPTMQASGQISGTFPPFTVTPRVSDGDQIWQVQFMGVIPSGMAGDSQLYEISLPPTGGDNIVKLKAYWVNAAQDFELRWYNKAGTLVGSAAIDFTAHPQLFDTPILYGISIYVDLPGSPGFVAVQFAAFEPGLPSAISFGVSSWTAPTIPTPQSWRALGSTNNAGWSFSHHALYSDPNLFSEPNQQDNADAILGLTGEKAGNRIIRLCRQTNTPLDFIGDPEDTNECGPQRPVTLLECLKDAADADQGILFDARDSLGLVYRTRVDLYNTPADATLDWTSSHHLADAKFSDDFKTARNYIVSRRFNGSFAVAEITSGRTSTSDAPDGIGIVPEDLSWNLAEDEQLGPFAGWRAHVKGWDEPRYDSFNVWRHRAEIYNDTTADAGVLALDFGDHLRVTSPRNDLPPENVDVLVQGFEETLANFEHKIDFSTTPQRPYLTFIFDDATQGRLEGDYYLVTAVNTSATSWNIGTSDGIMLDTVDADDGWQWMFDGELLTITDVAPSTITFVAAGTASTGSSGSRTPGAPAGIASGDLVFIFASTRNSGTGIPDTPANWYRFPVFDANANCQIFGRIYDGVWTMPTVTYTGGAANEDTIAQPFAFRGKFADLTKVFLKSASRLNSVAAQDIITPGVSITDLPDNLMALYLGWKQDDYTSVATPSGWTEGQEASSTAGNDASQIWGYRQSTSKPAAGSLQPAIAVTGGATAISRGAVMVFQSDYQVVTVTRQVNGISQSHAAGGQPRLYPAPYLAL